MIRLRWRRLSLPDSGCRFPPRKASGKGRFGQRQGGQIIIEYVLLLAIAVGIALLMTRTLIGRDQGNEGFIIRAWQTLVTQIGKDPADDLAKKPGP